jgi:hypothetical protein
MIGVLAARGFHPIATSLTGITSRKPRLLTSVDTLRPDNDRSSDTIITVSPPRVSTGLLFRMPELSCPPRRRIKIEAGVDTKGRAVVQDTPARTFCFREDPVGLLKGKEWKGDGQKVASFWSELAHVFGNVGILGVDHR